MFLGYKVLMFLAMFFFVCFDDFVDGMLLLLLLLFRWKLDPISPMIPGPSAWNDPHHEGGYHCISPSELFEWMLHVSNVCPAFTPKKIRQTYP